MHKVKLSLNRLAALTATSSFCLLATSCGEDGDKVSKEYKTEAETYRNLKMGDLIDKAIAKMGTEKGALISAGTATDDADINDYKALFGGNHLKKGATFPDALKALYNEAVKKDKVKDVLDKGIGDYSAVKVAS